MKKMDIAEQIAWLMRGVDDVISPALLEEKLKSGRRLKIKAGFDPTSTDLHLGHTVLLNKLRQFQMLGHEVIFLIGDFTALIGDPSGRDITRPQLTREAVNEHAKSYQEQVFKVLDPKLTTVSYNSQWLDQLSAKDLIGLVSHTTVARMLERDDFTKRFRENKSISIHEFIYPIMQGYDSVQLQADVELGGTDQRFNLLMPLLEGTDGVKKMSKSYNNIIGITSTPTDMFGRVMSIPDDLIVNYFALLTSFDNASVDRIRERLSAGENPRDVKMELAAHLVDIYHGDGAGLAQKEAFIHQFSKRQVPDDIPVIALTDEQKSWPLAKLLKELSLVKSTSEAARLVTQGAIKIDGEKLADAQSLVYADQMMIQVGKRRFIKLSL